MKLSKQLAANLLRCTIVAFFVVALFTNFSNVPTHADELSALNAKIQQKEREKNDTLKKIGDIENRINALLGQKGDINQKASTLSILNAQKSELDQQLGILEKQSIEQEEVLTIYEEKVKASENDIQEQTNYLYKLTYLNAINVFESNETVQTYFTQSAKTTATIEYFKQQVKDYQSKISQASDIRKKLLADKESTGNTKKGIEENIAKLQSEVDSYNRSLADANRSKNSLNAKINELSSQLKFMGEKQAALLQAELAKMNNSSQVQQVPLTDGQYYFSGRGRDLIDGHGLGMSQWGAYGMAQKGWSYDQILKFYYTGVTIGEYNEPTHIVVDGKTNGPIPFDDYLAGIGEVPNSWPPEAIKAQIVAARTYAMRAAYKGSDGHIHICGTDACQVYVGGTAKKQFVAETKRKVILFNGSPIVAYYSASHRGHSSTIKEVWGGADLPYIRPVNDDQWAYKDYQTKDPYNTTQMIKPYYWTWRTNGYSLEQLSDIFSKHNSLNVGKLQRIDIQKDSTGRRVARITMIGDKGSKTLTGWDFRAIFNSVTPYSDYVYSTEFTFARK